MDSDSLATLWSLGRPLSVVTNLHKVYEIVIAFGRCSCRQSLTLRPSSLPCWKWAPCKVIVVFSKPVYKAWVRIHPPRANHFSFTSEPSSCHVHGTLGKNFAQKCLAVTSLCKHRYQIYNSKFQHFHALNQLCLIPYQSTFCRKHTVCWI